MEVLDPSTWLAEYNLTLYNTDVLHCYSVILGLIHAFVTFVVINTKATEEGKSLVLLRVPEG